MTRLAHLADLHLGFRQFERHTPTGQNQREADVALAVHRALDGVIAAAPDAVVVAGDIFHSVRPTNGAILTAFAEFGRLRAALPHAPVLLIAGDHDSPRSSEAHSILALYRALGLTVVERGIELVHWPGLDVLAVPKGSARLLPTYPGPRGDILVLHGEVRDLPHADLAASALTDWRYVALGHWHVAQQVGPRAWYSGSVDYTSTDPWSELVAEAGAGKAWVLVELTDGEPVVTVQRIAPPRRFVDLPALDAEGLATAAIDTALAAQATSIDDAVVRQIVLNLSRETKHSLDYAAIRGFKGRALNYQLDTRRPADQVATVAARAGRMQRLDQILDEFLGARVLPPDVDRAALQALGQQYLTESAGSEDPYTGTEVSP